MSIKPIENLPPMKAIPIHQAKANLSKYIQQAKAGQTVYLGSFGKAEVMLVAVSKQNPKTWFGSMKGQFHVTDAEWEESEKDMAKMWEEYYQRIDAEED